MTTPITGINENEFLQNYQNIQQQQLANNMSIRPTLQYGVDKGELTEKDAVSYLQTGSMSQEGQSALTNLVTRLNENYNAMMEFFQTNNDVGENEEEISAMEKSKIDMIMSDGITTDEELQEVLENSETEETEEEPMEEEMEEEGDAERVAEVIAAFNAFMDDLEAGKDISEMSAEDHPGINAMDFNMIISDYADDKIIGNGDRKGQFQDGNIFTAAKERLAEDTQSGKLKNSGIKIEDQDDGRGYDADKGEDYKISEREKSRQEEKAKEENNSSSSNNDNKGKPRR